ncbi:MAG: c-type cytochrome [Planctomycetales bacterium]|nr:c-type cytochrome [Planctomycetales bacterium]
MHFLKVLLPTLLTVCASLNILVAQEDREDDPYLPGLIAEYSDHSRHSFRRLDEAIALHWDDASPDPRITADNFDVHWHGRIFTQGAGEYRLAVHASGEVEVKLAGKVVILRQEAAGWAFSKPVTLEFDRHELEVSFRKTKSPAQISLFWSGPQFQLEPVPPRLLMHDRKGTVSTSFERGELLASALRCAACHHEEGASKPMLAPSLLQLSGNVSEEWLETWLSDHGREQTSIQRRMPSFGFSANEAKAISAYLLAVAPDNKSPAKPPAIEKPTGKKPKDPPSAATGERLFLTLGCLACHQVGELGESGLFGGGDLSHVAAKRPSAFFSAWLAEPAKHNPDHRMPVFDLSPGERSSLSLYLTSLGTAAKSARQEPPATDLVAAGRKLVQSHRCGNCHALPKDPEFAAATGAKLLSAKSDWGKSCATNVASSRAHLGYSLNREDQKALQDYYSAPLASPRDKSKPSGRFALLKNNCLACHGREGAESLSASLPKKLADKLASLSEKHPELAASIPAMTPPSLNSIGDKYHEEALAAVIHRQGPPLRDYLLVRMPRFPLSDDELKRLTSYFIQTDRIPPLPDVVATKPTPAEEAAFSLAGNRLVSTDGFGCTSCHQVGKVIPDKAPLNARGPSLSSLDKRIRKEWYDRFLRNPARIVPRMEMPSVQIPVRGVLDSKLDPQLAALWHVLATPGFEPPEPNPVRVARVPGFLSPAIAVTDLVQYQGKTFTRPFLVGLSNRHNMLFDLQANRLVGCWLGDAARQRTRGKSWYWDAGHHNLLPSTNGDSEISLILNGKEHLPVTSGDVKAELRGWGMEGGWVPHYVSLHYRLRFLQGDGESIDVLVKQQFFNSDTSSVSRVSRTFSFEGIPTGAAIRLRLATSPNGKSLSVSKDLKQIHFDANDISHLNLHHPPDAKFFANGCLDIPGAVDNKEQVYVLGYTTKLKPDSFEGPWLVEMKSELSFLEIGNGLQGRRLPLMTSILPTGFTWNSKGELFFCTLRGEVCSGVDNNEDGAEDRVEILLDGLPAPYGISTAKEAIDVLSKTELLRLNIGRGVKTSVVASGWGYSPDYHDWAIGLPRTSGGDYLLGLPCQQDERASEAAKYRGTVSKLVPRKVTKDDPREYSMEVLSTGHRFPMGLAVNRDGDLFVTDNQGNYNPFNELNHVRKGAFFGFVNAIDKKNKDYKAPPTTEPAINIPHPWTRSVNGICFLYTPEKLKKETGKDAFGPLEGQLVGCEYDTRRLIRMSLQKIGETYQGCAYPLSKEPSSPEKGFLGPIVCAVSPRGELYVGSIRESGWGAGNNVGEIVKIKFEPEKLPCGIAEVKAVKGGFSIDFLREVDAKKGADIANYSISSYRRISTPAYGGPDVDRRIEKINSVELSQDRRRVIVQLPELRTGGFVYEIQLKSLAPGDAEFFPAEAYFTLHGVP